MAIMRLKTMMAIIVITCCNIMLFAGRGGALFLKVAGGGTCSTSFGKYGKILEEIFSQARFECDLELSAKFGPHPDPTPVRIVLTQTPFVLIQTPFALIKIRSALTRTRFALTTT